MKLWRIRQARLTGRHWILFRRDLTQLTGYRVVLTFTTWAEAIEYADTHTPLEVPA